MKHFALLLFIGLVGYMAWAAVSRKERRQAGRLAGRHSKPILIMLAVLLAGLVIAFFFPSTKIL